MGPSWARARPSSTRASTVSRWCTFRYRTHRTPTTGARDSSRWETPPFADISTASRCSIENAGTWGETTVLFTSDHPYREAESFDGKSDPRIPYLLKMASQNGGGVY